MDKFYYPVSKQCNHFIVTADMDTQDMTTQPRYKTFYIPLM